MVGGSAILGRMHAPTIIELPSKNATEAARAKFWRKTIVRLTRKELAERIGYSTQAISLFEQGYDHRGKPIGARAWKRYRLVCAGLAATLRAKQRGKELRAWMDEKGYDE